MKTKELFLCMLFLLLSTQAAFAASTTSPEATKAVRTRATPVLPMRLARR